MAKFEEGLEHIRLAEKSLKTSLLKWRPDYDTAGDEYTKAAQSFRVAKSLDKSKECFLKASQAYKENKSLFHAAKSVEQAILVAKELVTPLEVKSMAQNACHLYQQHGSGDSGAAILDRAAKIVEEHNPEIALSLYQQAADVVSTEDRSHKAAEYVSKVARILVKLQMYDHAADAIRREIGYHQESESYGSIGRLTVALVLVQLARGDSVAAEKAFKEWGNCCEASECQTVEELIQAYDDEDPDLARQALSSPFIRHMDVEYSKLARIIPLPKAIQAAPRAAVRENAAPSYVPVSERAAQEVGITAVEVSSEPEPATSTASSSEPAARPPHSESEEELC